MSSNVVKIQQVSAAVRKAGLSIGRKLSSHTGWVFESVDNNNNYSLTINGLVYTPAETVRVHYNVSQWADYCGQDRDEQLPALIAAIEARGWVIEQTDYLEWIVKAA